MLRSQRRLLTVQSIIDDATAMIQWPQSIYLSHKHYILWNTGCATHILPRKWVISPGEKLIAFTSIPCPNCAKKWKKLLQFLNPITCCTINGETMLPLPQSLGKSGKDWPCLRWQALIERYWKDIWWHRLLLTIVPLASTSSTSPKSKKSGKARRGSTQHQMPIAARYQTSSSHKYFMALASSVNFLKNDCIRI